MDPRKTKRKAGDAAKTDRLDARRFADAVRRASVASSYIPSRAIRELREVCRGRQQVVRVRTKLVQAIRALLLRLDVAEPSVKQLTSRRGFAWVGMGHLVGDAEAGLRRLERLLAVVHEEARAADALVQTRAADPIAVALTRLRGVGPVLSLTLRAEIGAISRFARGPALASYAGLVPGVHQGGTTSR